MIKNLNSTEIIDKLEAILNNSNDKSIKILITHLKHWIDEYNRFQKQSKSMHPNCMAIQALGCIKSNLCVLQSLDLSNIEYYETLIKVVDKYVQYEINSMDKKYSSFWREKKIILYE